MSLLQMAGGVAVAGAVAAGTTAFTASGLTTPSVYVGGSATISTNGISVSSIIANWNATTPTYLDSFTVTFGAGTPNGTHVAMIVDDGTPHTFTCGNVNTLTSTCTAHSATYAPGTNISTISITA